MEPYPLKDKVPLIFRGCYMKLINLRNGYMIAERVKIADSFPSRLIGLIGRRTLPEHHALALSPCSSIHTFFMRFSIDVLFLDDQGEVVHLIQEMYPYRLSPVVKSAKMVIELSGGTVKNRVSPGDILKIER